MSDPGAGPAVSVTADMTALGGAIDGVVTDAGAGVDKGRCDAAASSCTASVPR